MAVNFKNPETFARTIGVPAKSVATFKSIGQWASLATGVYGAVVFAIDIIKKVLEGDDPAQDALNELRAEARNIRDKTLADELTDKLDSATAAHGAVKFAAATLRDFVAQPSEAKRTSLFNQLTGLGQQIIGRSPLDANRLPFDPLAYKMLSGETPPDWLMKHGSWFLHTGFPVTVWLQQNAPAPLPPEEQSAAANSLFFGGPLHTQFVQALRPVKSGPDHYDGPPANLQLNAFRWDGRFNHPILMLGAMTFENALRSVEPYYRMTGDRREQFEEIVAALDRFADDWEDQLLWSAPMPAPWAPSNDAMSLLFGFEEWPCGAVDPVFGTASFQNAWWTPGVPPDWGTGGPAVGLMSSSQGQQFMTSRGVSLSWVRRFNGLDVLRETAKAMRSLLFPPWASECMTAFPDKAIPVVDQVLQSEPAAAKTFNIVKPATLFDGTLEARHVRVRFPIAVQGNPGLDGVPNLPRLAASDVTFGYKLELVGTNQRFTLFEAPLRRTAGQQGIWHTTDVGLQALQPVPRTTQPLALQYHTRTYLRYAEPSGKLHRQDEIANGTVSISVKVTVSDAAHDPIQGLSAEWPPRGVIWLEIESADVSNRSFELYFEVTETTSVNSNGRPTSDNNALVRYKVSGEVAVDALVGVFPAEYHAQYELERQLFFNMVKGIAEEYRPIRPLGPPRPDDKFDPLQDILDMVADPRWSPAVLADFDRVMESRESSSRDAIVRGIEKLRQHVAPSRSTRRAATQLPRAIQMNPETPTASEILVLQTVSHHAAV